MFNFKNKSGQCEYNIFLFASIKLFYVYKPEYERRGVHCGRCDEGDDGNGEEKDDNGFHRCCGNWLLVMMCLKSRIFIKTVT